MKLAHNEIKVWCKDIVLISFTVHVVFKEVLFMRIYGNSNSVNLKKNYCC